MKASHHFDLSQIGILLPLQEVDLSHCFEHISVRQSWSVTFFSNFLWFQTDECCPCKALYNAKLTFRDLAARAVFSCTPIPAYLLTQRRTL